MADETVNAKWEQLQAMRNKRDGDRPRDAETGKFVKQPDEAALAAQAAAVQAEQAALEQSTPEPTPPAAAAPEPPPPPPPVVTPPNSEEIEIDGQKISVDPTLAAAFKKAEEIKKTVDATADRERLKAELKAEIQAELPKKSEAELAAEKALAEAQAKLNEPQMPDSKLLIEDPEEYNRRMKAYVDTVAENARKSTKAEIAAEHAKTQTATAAFERERAKAVLNAQFYDQYPILKDSKTIVDRILDDQFNAVFASGKVANLKSAEEGEQLKKTEFADAAAKATKEIVKLMAAGKKIAPPPPPPPALVASAPAKSPAPPKQDTEKTTKERFPKGSVSASLAEIRAKKMAANG